MNIPRSIRQPHKTRSLSQIEPLDSLLTPTESICEYWTTLAHQSVEQRTYPLVRVVQYSQIDSVGVSSDSNGSICESERVLCGWLIERGIFIVISAFLLGLI